ncbi:MAG: permease [Acholeplasmatales bacterium]|nr:MAG: permease [Acholeplasmatales bacterium]
MSAFFEVIGEALRSGGRFLLEYTFFPGDGETFSLARLVSLLLAFSISGAMAVFIPQGAILKYFGPDAKKTTAYAVASVSGAVLAVCSCSVLPMFASIRRKGAGLGPAVAFLFSGPAINILAMTMTFTDLGPAIAVVRVGAAVLLASLIGVTLAVLYGKSERRQKDGKIFAQPDPDDGLATWQRILFFTTMIGILLFGVYRPIPTVLFVVLLIGQLVLFFRFDDVKAWFKETAVLAKKILPLFVIGIFAAGVIQSFMSQAWLVRHVGENLYRTNLLAAFFGAFMYFATLTEIPIVRTFLDLGMHPGPATALLIAGPSLSLPNMIVIGKVLGAKKTLTYVTLVVLLGALAGWLAGLFIYVT